MSLSFKTQPDTNKFNIKYILGWVIFPAFLFLPFCFLNLNWFYNTSDSLFYINILTFVTEALKKGNVHLYWTPDANDNFGSPVMMFYAPLAYLITALINFPFSFLNFNIITQFFIGLYASQIVSGYTAWVWLKSKFYSPIAYIGSLLFVMLPFKLNYILLHGNLAQLWALAFLPVWMWAADNILEEKKFATGIYALACAGVYYCHPLTVIVFAPVPAAYVMWFGRNHRFYDKILRLTTAHILAATLCLMHALPQWLNLDWIRPDLFLQSYPWKENFFHIDGLNCIYYIIIAILVGYAIANIPSVREQQNAKESVFWIIILFTVAFMTQRPSAFIWEHLPFLQYLQFPSMRFHATALMGMIYLSCEWLTYCQNNNVKRLAPLAYHPVILALFVILFSVLMIQLVIDVYKKPAVFDGHLVREMKILRVPEYKTHWGCRDYDKSLKDYQEHKHFPELFVESGRADVSVMTWQPPQHIVLKANVTSQTARLTIRQCYIPAWQATEDNGNPLIIMPGKEQGLIELELKQGLHKIDVSFIPDMKQTVSKWVSIVAFLICLFLCIPQRQKSYP